jgi:hypothetical protein
MLAARDRTPVATARGRAVPTQIKVSQGAVARPEDAEEKLRNPAFGLLTHVHRGDLG